MKKILQRFFNVFGYEIRKIQDPYDIKHNFKEGIDRSFWELQHKHKDHYWLTGSSLQDIMQYHELTKEDIIGKKILEIGVGEGTLSSDLVGSNYAKLICSDISSVALERVAPIADAIYLTTDLHTIEPVDLAICHLVFQHCKNEEVVRILKEVNLAENGVFSFQIASLREGEKPNKKVQKLIDSGSHFFRTPAEIEKWLENSNKKISRVSKPYSFYEPENFDWYIIKVVNKG